MDDKQKLRAFAGALVRSSLKDMPGVAHFEHIESGQAVSTDNENDIASLRADPGWREVIPQSLN